MTSQRNATIAWALVGCAGLAVTLLCVAGGVGYAVVSETGDVSGSVEHGARPTRVDGSPLRVRAIVESGTGRMPVPRQTNCDFTVQRHDRPGGGYWCNAQIVCGGRLLYGGPRSGYFPCTLHDGPGRHVVGSDPGTTSADTDAALEIDSRRGLLIIRDDATGRYGRYELRARILGVW